MTNDEAEYAEFCQLCQQRPDDWALRLAFADWLEEHNYPFLADFYRKEAARIRRRLNDHDDRYRARQEQRYNTNSRVDKLHRRRERGAW